MENPDNVIQRACTQLTNYMYQVEYTCSREFGINHFSRPKANDSAARRCKTSSTPGTAEKREEHRSQNTKHRYSYNTYPLWNHNSPGKFTYRRCDTTCADTVAKQSPHPRHSYHTIHNIFPFFESNLPWEAFPSRYPVRSNACCKFRCASTSSSSSSSSLSLSLRISRRNSSTHAETDLPSWKISAQPTTAKTARGLTRNRYRLAVETRTVFLVPSRPLGHLYRTLARFVGPSDNDDVSGERLACLNVSSFDGEKSRRPKKIVRRSSSLFPSCPAYLTSGFSGWSWDVAHPLWAVSIRTPGPACAIIYYVIT